MKNHPNESYNGYLVVASKKYEYYQLAINALESIKDYYPESNLCLVTEERFCDGREEIADHLVFITESHYRSKLWGMAQTPFDITLYVDADMECHNEGVKDVFNLLGDNDLMFKDLPEKAWRIFKDVKFPGGMFTLCGAICLYRNTPLVMEFMNDWYEYYKLQSTNKWWPTKEDGITFDVENYPHHLRVWDQFTLFWLTERVEKYSGLKVGVFEDPNERLNYWSSLRSLNIECPDDVIFIHHSTTGVKNIK